MALNVNFGITPNTLPWMASAMAFKSVDGYIAKIITGQGYGTSSFNFSIFGGPNVGDLLVLNCQYAVDSTSTTGPLTFSDSAGNTYNAGPQEFYTDINGNTYSLQQFWSLITTSPGYLTLDSSGFYITGGTEPPLFLGTCAYEIYRGDTVISFEDSNSSQGTSGDASVVINPVSPTPTVIGACLVDGLATAFPPGVSISYEPPFTGYLYSGGAYGIGDTTQIAAWAGVYIVYSNPVLGVTIYADDQTKCFGTEFIFNGTEFTNTPLQPGDYITSCTITSDGSPADAPAGSYPVIISDAVGHGLDKYEIGYIEGTMTVSICPPPSCQLVDFPLPGPYTDPSGQPITNGTVSIRLVFDCNCPCADYQITGNNHSILQLDGDGIIIGSPQIRPNNQLKPDGSYYILQVYTESGQLIYGPRKLVI